MGHTPGPWAVREPDPEERQADIADGLAPEDMELTEVYAEDAGQQVCYVMNDTPAEASNARLIAAAPELLHSLRECFEMLEDYYDAISMDGDERAILASTRAVIAKAEGGDA